jgi:hypothetical protein
MGTLTIQASLGSWWSAPMPMTRKILELKLKSRMKTLRCMKAGSFPLEM